MLKRYLAVVFIIAFAISLAGCGAKQLIGTKSVPPLGEYSNVTIAPFDIKKPSGNYDELPTMLAYGAGTKLSIKFSDKTWNYNQSGEVKPVSDKMQELGLTPEQLYENVESAVKLGKALGSDLIIAGLLTEPRYDIQRSGKVEYDMSEQSATGAARYYAVHQNALFRVKLKIIEVKSGKILWNEDVLGYRKYKTRYRTGGSEKVQREETMYADIRRDFVNNFLVKLYPESFSLPKNK